VVRTVVGLVVGLLVLWLVLTILGFVLFVATSVYGWVRRKTAGR